MYFVVPHFYHFKPKALNFYRTPTLCIAGPARRTVRGFGGPFPGRPSMARRTRPSWSRCGVRAAFYT
eukprot:5527188-Prymnesium_polylepis.1